MNPQGVEVFVATDAVDMRFGFERLGGLVRERVQREPRSRAVFVFFVVSRSRFSRGTGRAWCSGTRSSTTGSSRSLDRRPETGEGGGDERDSE